ncbi:unnamed protein product [Arabidopsis halleri]
MHVESFARRGTSVVLGFAEAWHSFNVNDVIAQLKELGGWEKWWARVEAQKKLAKEKLVKLERDVVKQENKVKFVVAVRDSVLNLDCLSSVDAVIEALKNQGFVPFPEEASEEFQGYNYLMDMLEGLAVYPQGFDMVCAEGDLAKAALAYEKTILSLELEEEDQFAF